MTVTRRGNRNRFTPFVALSRHRQRDAFVRLRRRIVRDTPIYGRLFTSPLVLDEPGRPDIYRQWFDVLFLGLDGRSIWNATITTGGWHSGSASRIWPRSRPGHA